MFFQEKQKSSQRKIHKSFAKQFIEIPYSDFYKFTFEIFQSSLGLIAPKALGIGAASFAREAIAERAKI